MSASLYLAVKKVKVSLATVARKQLHIFCNIQIASFSVDLMLRLQLNCSSFIIHSSCAALGHFSVEIYVSLLSFKLNSRDEAKDICEFGFSAHFNSYRRTLFSTEHVIIDDGSLQSVAAHLDVKLIFFCPCQSFQNVFRYY